MPVRGQQARALNRYLRREVRAYSPHYGPLLDRVIRDRDGRSGIDLADIPLTPWSSVTDPRRYVLHPDVRSIRDHGEPLLGLRTVWARLLGARTTAKLNRDVIDPKYKPLHWLVADGVPVGSSSDDLDRLTELGRRWLEDAGVRFADVVVSVVPPEPTLGYWELVLASRRAGLSTVFLPPDAPTGQIARLRPTVLAGRPQELDRILAGPPEDLPVLRTVLAIDEPLAPGQRARLEANLLPDDAAVLAAWAPPGVRSLWTECRGRAGLHTSPSAEVVEVVEDEVVWTALGWAGTVFVRLRTGVIATVVDSVCPGCKRATPRVVTDAGRPVTPARRPRPFAVEMPEPEPDEVPEPLVEIEPEPVPGPVGNGAAAPAFIGLLDDHPGVAAWQVELRTVAGEEEVLVFLSPVAEGGAVPVLTELAAEIPVTQFVVLSQDELGERLARHDDRQVVDLR